MSCWSSKKAENSVKPSKCGFGVSLRASALWRDFPPHWVNSISRYLFVSKLSLSLLQCIRDVSAPESLLNVPICPLNVGRELPIVGLAVCFPRKPFCDRAPSTAPPHREILHVYTMWQKENSLYLMYSSSSLMTLELLKDSVIWKLSPRLENLHLQLILVRKHLPHQIKVALSRTPPLQPKF